MLYTVSRTPQNLTNEELIEIFDRASRDDPETAPALTELRAEILRRMGPCTRSHMDQYLQQGLGLGLGQAR